MKVVLQRSKASKVTIDGKVHGKIDKGYVLLVGFTDGDNEEIIKKINKVVFPGIQGGPLMHVIAAKAQCFYEALQPEFIDYAKNIIKNANAMAEEFKKNGVKVVSNATDNHLMLIDVKSSFGISGKTAEETLDKINITVNKKSCPSGLQG